MNIRQIDLNTPNAAEELIASFRETGFAVIKNHSITKRDLDLFYAMWAQFFDSDWKSEYLFNPKTQSGYFPFKSENAKGYSTKDLKEFYHAFYPFGDVPEELKNVTYSIGMQLGVMGTRVLKMLDDNLPDSALGTEPFSRMIEESNQTLFRILHYPPLGGEDEPDAVRAAAHEDINLITLLPAATQPGLEVKDVEGNWHKVECDPGMIVINVSDMLAEATGGYLKSTTHRVVNPNGLNANVSRYSAPLFVHPRPEVRLSNRYTAGEYLAQRLKEIGLK